MPAFLFPLFLFG